MKPTKAISTLFAIAALAAVGGALFVVATPDRSTGDRHSDQQSDAKPPSSASLPDNLQQRLPAATQGAKPTPAQPEATASEQTAMVAVPRPIPPPPLGPVGPLREGLAALSAKRIDDARAARDTLPDDALDRHILAWAIALYGGTDVPSSDIAWAIEHLPAWPGSATLRRNGERAAYRDDPVDMQTIKQIAGSEPQTLEGAILLARDALAAGNKDGARRVLSPLWRKAEAALREEMIVISEFGQVLSHEDHRARMETLLYGEHVQSAMRIADLAGAKELATAWSAVLRRSRDAGKLLDAVPAAQRGAGYQFARGRYLRQLSRNGEAAAVLIKAPTEKSALIDPAAWWSERRLVARRMLDAGKPKVAYELAAGHAADSPADIAEAEFHAGWIALRFLKDAKTAARHFARIVETGEGAITLARGYYWMARAAEAGGPGDASALYAKSARYGTTFYGQLAAAKTGSSTLNLAEPATSDTDRIEFGNREAVRAIDRLSQSGFSQYASRLYTDLAQQITSPGELSLLAAKAGASANHFLALRVGKIGMQRGIDVGALSHPIGAIPESAQISAAGKALAYAVARQESEFNTGAVSQAGALGLLQLMPATAKIVATRLGVEYSVPRLTTDAAYNATLGAEELNQQLQRYAGSYVLTFIAYNAGPKRADQWVKRYGDPRGKSVEDVVDWIERVPFSETRSYIQRVLENYEVYKMRLSGHADIESDLTTGRTSAVR